MRKSCGHKLKARILARAACAAMLVLTPYFLSCEGNGNLDLSVAESDSNDSSFEPPGGIGFGESSPVRDTDSGRDNFGSGDVWSVDGAEGGAGVLQISIAGELQNISDLWLVCYGRQRVPLGVPPVRSISVGGLRPGSFIVKAICGHEERSNAHVEVQGAGVSTVVLDAPACNEHEGPGVADLRIVFEWTKYWHRLPRNVVPSSKGASLELKPIGMRSYGIDSRSELIYLQEGISGKKNWDLKELPVHDYLLKLEGFAVEFVLKPEDIAAGSYVARVEAPLGVTCSFYLNDGTGTQIIPKQMHYSLVNEMFSASPDVDGDFLIYLPAGRSCTIYVADPSIDLEGNRSKAFSAKSDGEHWRIPVRRVRTAGELGSH